MEPIILVKSLRGTYEEDKEMVIEVVNAYDKMVEGNPSYSTYTAWRRKSTTSK